MLQMLEVMTLGLLRSSSILALIASSVGTSHIWEKEKKLRCFQVRKVEIRDTILAVCQERGDDWANAVQARLLCVHDLHAADAVYHKVCSVNFRTRKQIPVEHEHEMSTSKRAK